MPIKNENIIFFNIPVSFSTKIQIYSAPKNAFSVAEPPFAGNSAPKSAKIVAKPPRSTISAPKSAKIVAKPPLRTISAPKNAFSVAEPRSAGNSAPKSALFVAEPGTEPGAEWGDGDGFVGKNIIFVVIQEIIFKN